MIKAAFFDVDWTLYDHEAKCYVSSGIEAIKKLKKKGVKVFVCSARPYDSLKKFGVFDLGIKWDGYIGSAGSIAVVKNKTVYKSVMKKEDVKKLVKFLKENNLAAEFITPKTRFLVGKYNEDVATYYGVYVDVLPSEKEYRNQEVTGALFFCKEQYDAPLEKILPNLVYYRFFETGLDIMPKLHKKGEAISHILKYLGIHRSEAIGFGDDIQDITMKEGLDTFVCVGNGKDEVKEAASFVTKPIIEDGIEFAMQQLGLI